MYINYTVDTLEYVALYLKKNTNLQKRTCIKRDWQICLKVAHLSYKNSLSGGKVYYSLQYY